MKEKIKKIVRYSRHFECKSLNGFFHSLIHHKTHEEDELNVSMPHRKTCKHEKESEHYHH